MFCSKCGNEIAEGAAFCQKCGTKVVYTDTDQQPMDIPVQDAEGQKDSEAVKDTQQSPANNTAKANGGLRKAATIGRVLMWGSLLLLILSSFGALRINPAVLVAGVVMGIILSALGAKRPLGLSKKIELAVAGVLLVVIAVSVMSSGGKSDKYVEIVKGGTLDAYPQMTVGKAFDSFLDDPKWESGLSDNNERFVNVKGGILYNGKEAEITVQFLVDEKSGLFQYYACEIDGITQNNLVAWELFEIIYNDGSASTESGSQGGSNSMLGEITIGETQSFDDDSFGSMEVTLDYVQFTDRRVNTLLGGYIYPDEDFVFLRAVFTFKNTGTANATLPTAWSKIVYDGTYEFECCDTEGDMGPLPPLSAATEGEIVFMVPAAVMEPDKPLVLNIGNGSVKDLISYTIRSGGGLLGNTSNEGISGESMPAGSEFTNELSEDDKWDMVSVWLHTHGITDYYLCPASELGDDDLVYEDSDLYFEVSGDYGTLPGIISFDGNDIFITFPILVDPDNGEWLRTDIYPIEDWYNYIWDGRYDD